MESWQNHQTNIYIEFGDGASNALTDYANAKFE